MTKVLIDKSLLEQALGCLVRAEALYRQPNELIQLGIIAAMKNSFNDTPIAYEFYNPDTGHAIVDYDEYTHVGHLTTDKGYLKYPLYKIGNLK